MNDVPWPASSKATDPLQRLMARSMTSAGSAMPTAPITAWAPPAASPAKAARQAEAANDAPTTMSAGPHTRESLFSPSGVRLRR